VTKPYSSPPTILRSLRDRLTQVAERQGVVFGRGPDCWLVMGYTGLAHFDDKPTDVFIASVLAGGRELTGMGMWFPARPLHYREITRSVENAMFDAYSRLPAAARDHRTTLSGVGVQNRKPRPRHVAFRAGVSRQGINHLELADRHQPLISDHGIGPRCVVHTAPIGDR
jgi:hypothetical protein